MLFRSDGGEDDGQLQREPCPGVVVHGFQPWPELLRRVQQFQVAATEAEELSLHEGQKIDLPLQAYAR